AAKVGAVEPSAHGATRGGQVAPCGTIAPPGQVLRHWARDAAREPSAHTTGNTWPVGGFAGAGGLGEGGAAGGTAGTATGGRTITGVGGRAGSSLGMTRLPPPVPGRVGAGGWAGGTAAGSPTGGRAATGVVGRVDSPLGITMLKPPVPGPVGAGSPAAAASF